MLKIGVTGGIGSGKSTVCKVFRNLGIPVFDSDTEAKNILSHNKQVIESVKKLVGPDAYFSDGLPDRKKIAEIVFYNEKKLQQLNKIIHPIVVENFENWSDKYSELPFVIQEAALIFESGISKKLDKVILVYTPVEERILRVIQRDKLSRTDIQNRIKNQMSDEEKKKISDFIIYNSDKDMVLPQILTIYNELYNLQ